MLPAVTAPARGHDVAGVIRAAPAEWDDVIYRSGRPSAVDATPAANIERVFDIGSDEGAGHAVFGCPNVGVYGAPVMPVRGIPIALGSAMVVYVAEVFGAAFCGS